MKARRFADQWIAPLVPLASAALITAMLIFLLMGTGPR